MTARVLVVGAGIAGLAAATAPRQRRTPALVVDGCPPRPDGECTGHNPTPVPSNR